MHNKLAYICIYIHTCSRARAHSHIYYLCSLYIYKWESEVEKEINELQSIATTMPTDQCWIKYKGFHGFFHQVLAKDGESVSPMATFAREEIFDKQITIRGCSFTVSSLTSNVGWVWGLLAWGGFRNSSFRMIARAHGWLDTIFIGHGTCWRGYTPCSSLICL